MADGTNRPPPEPQAAAQEPEREPRPLAERHEVYTAMLRYLPLSEQHRMNLRRRGLDDLQIARNEYRSLPKSPTMRAEVSARLAEQFSLEGIPGFHRKYGHWTIAGNEGLFIPVRDWQGRIQGLQIRLDDEAQPNRKYRWLSSRGYKDGCNGKAYLHITGNRACKTAYLTEGGLKGDTASALSGGALFLCVSGVTALKELKALLPTLEVEELMVVLDMDRIINPNVQAATKKIRALCAELPGLRVRFPVWDPCFKGVDDYGLARYQGYEPMKLRPTPLTEYLERFWAARFPLCDRRFLSLCEWEQLKVPIASIRCANPLREEYEAVGRFRAALRAGKKYPPLVCVNGQTAERTRYWACYFEGYRTIQIYQNRPWLPAVAA